MADIVKEAVDETVQENAEMTAERPRPHGSPATGRYLAFLSLAALGVVYGDIGTSPLYALRECFHGHYGIAPTPTNVFGVLSLIFWSLIIVVTIKYLVFVLRADNRGEGGILALTALAAPIHLLTNRERRWLVVLGVFGAALLYGDGIITPAISVLSAVEGLQIVTPLFEPYVLPITLAIIVGLFLIQSQGTGSVGRIFGPIMLLWFTTLAALGVWHIGDNPGILASINPVYGVSFFRENGWVAFLVLGTVFLVVTGGEALYADMGHFGRRPIRLAWFVLVLPALMLNYFGQGAMLLNNPETARNPFYLMAPDWALLPLVVLATLATVIASQALISGAFSITMQAVQLNFLPRLQIFHTSRTEYGQIYIPTVNWMLMFACIIVVLGFRTSSNLAAAYGVAVTSTMAITTVIFYIVIRERWGWSRLRAGLLSGAFLVVDLAFLAANLIKIPQGGWFPLVLAALLFVVMTTWKGGRRLVVTRQLDEELTVPMLIQQIKTMRPARVPGIAVFLSGNPAGAPSALLANLGHNRVLHETVVLVTAQTQEVAQVEEQDRVSVEMLDQGFYQMIVRFGFMEEQDIPSVIERLDVPGLKLDPQRITYFVNRTKVIATELPGMALWREKFFALMSRNTTSNADYFCLPPTRVIEIGRSVEV